MYSVSPPPPPPPSVFYAPSYKFMLLYSTLRCKKNSKCALGHKKHKPTKLGGQKQNRSQFLFGRHLVQLATDSWEIKPATQTHTNCNGCTIQWYFTNPIRRLLRSNHKILGFFLPAKRPPPPSPNIPHFFCCSYVIKKCFPGHGLVRKWCKICGFERWNFFSPHLPDFVQKNCRIPPGCLTSCMSTTFYSTAPSVTNFDDIYCEFKISVEISGEYL